MLKKDRISLYGYGCVGQGFTTILEEEGKINLLENIHVRDSKKKRNRMEALFRINNEFPDADLLRIDAMSDEKRSWEVIRKGIAQGTVVVSASKRALAENLQELVHMEARNAGFCLYEAAVCAAIPVIRLLDTQYAEERINELAGIFNGTSNFILDAIAEHGCTYKDALQQAQEKGFAEADPSSDVDGWDATYKLCILVLHAFGIILNPKEVLRQGISKVNATDISFARAQGWQVKPCATAWIRNGALNTIVTPQFVKRSEAFFDVSAENNAVSIDAVYSGAHTWIGKGAGGFPTGQALYADYSRGITGSAYAYNKFKNFEKQLLLDTGCIDIYVRFGASGMIDTHWFKDLFDLGEFHSSHYAVGTISLNDLRNSGWLGNEHVQVIVMPERTGTMLLN